MRPPHFSTAQLVSQCCCLGACSAPGCTSSRRSEATLKTEAAAAGPCCFMLKLGADSAVRLISRRRSPQWRGARTTTSIWSQHCGSWLPRERLKARSAAQQDCNCGSALSCCPCSSVAAPSPPRQNMSCALQCCKQQPCLLSRLDCALHLCCSLKLGIPRQSPLTLAALCCRWERHLCSTRTAEGG